MKEKHVIVHVTECNLLLVSYYQFATQRAAAGVSSKFEVATGIRGRADAFTNESKVPSFKNKKWSVCVRTQNKRRDQRTSTNCLIYGAQLTAIN